MALSLLTLAEPLLALRIVSTSPQLAELVFQLGHGDSLVATSEQSRFPAEAQQLPSVGPMFMPSIEATFQFRPDWVLLDGQNINEGYARALTAQRIRSFRVDISSLQSLVTQSQRLLNDIYADPDNAQLKRYARCVPRRAPIAHFSYLAVVWASPVVLFSRQTFLSDVLSYAGGTNQAPSSWKQPFPRVSEEWMMRSQVDVVFFLDDLPDTRENMERLVRRWWPRSQPIIEALSSDHFSRSTFTALLHLDDLSVTRPKTRFRECVEKKP